MTVPDPEQIERALAAAWPALETVVDGGWEARFARGYSGRSNAIQVLDPADDREPAPRLAHLAGLYRDRGQMPLVKVTPLMGAATRRAVEDLGWALYHDSLVLAAPVEALAFGEAGPDLHVAQPTADDWLDAQAGLQGYSATTRAILAEIVARLPEGAAGVTLSDDSGTPVASGLVAVVDDIMVPLNVIVAPSARRQGHGQRLMSALLAWGIGRGATTAAIQVMRSNTAAVALYGGLGFSPSFSYHYRREEQPL